MRSTALRNLHQDNAAQDRAAHSDTAESSKTTIFAHKNQNPLVGVLAHLQGQLQMVGNEHRSNVGSWQAFHRRNYNPPRRVVSMLNRAFPGEKT